MPTTATNPNDDRANPARVRAAVELGRVKAPWGTVTGHSRLQSFGRFAIQTCNGRNNVEIGVDREQAIPGYFSGRRLGFGPSRRWFDSSPRTQPGVAA